MIESIKEWQTLIGGVMGGLFALGAALIVSHRLEHRQDRSSAMLVAGTLVWVVGAQREIEAWCNEENIDAAKEPIKTIERLLFGYPKLSSGFEAAALRLYPVHEKLAIHLDIFRSIYANLEDSLDSLTKGVATGGPQQGNLFPSMQMEPQASAALASLESAVVHAEATIKLIEYLVLSKTPTLNRLRIHVWPPKKIKEILRMAPDDSA